MYLHCCVDCKTTLIAEYDCPHSLLVLAEEELVALDLETEGWPCYKLPYLCSLHSSAITCAQHVGNIPEQLSTKVTDAGEQQMPNFSARVSTDSAVYCLINSCCLRKYVILENGKQDVDFMFLSCLFVDSYQ